MTITTDGLNDFLDVLFHGSTQRGTWYFGLIDNSGFSSVSADDTPSSHAGWTENTDYESETRPAWVEAAASGASITTGTVTTITMTAAATIAGVALFSDSQKGGTVGKIGCMKLFASPRSFADGESWDIESFTITASG